MLVLTRLPGEKIVLETLNGPVEITFVKQQGKRMSVGFVAPTDVRILRSELTCKELGNGSAKMES